MIATTSWSAGVVHAADGTPTPHQLKAVFIVGPTNSLTSMNLTDAESLAETAESLGMDVHRVFFPHATWANVLANIQGANLVVYMGHGYGWPSPYTKVLTESRQDGMGLNTYDGSSTSNYTYYGANLLKQYVQLAPNAVVFLNHLCYSAGNGEPGMSFPTYDLAAQRVDNMASGWLSIGAKAVFAYGEQLFVRALRNMMDTTKNPTMEDVFTIPPPVGKSGEYWGWVGWDARKYASVRTPGATEYLDPSQKDGWYRAVTGNLSMTAADWRNGPESPDAPNMTNLNTWTDGGAALVGGSMPLFTPNGDGSTDAITFTYTTNKETFVDWQVEDAGNNVVRSFSSWSIAGKGQGSWNGKDDSGAYVPDGVYTVTGTPSSRAGNAGTPLSVNIRVMTTIKSAAASPNLFYPTDGDNLSPRTTLSFTLVQPATVTWVVTDKNNNVVRTNLTSVSLGAGAQTWTWDGKSDSATFVPDGTYYSVVTAATADCTYSQRVVVDVRAFRLAPATPAPFVRGKKVQFTIWSAEPLSSSYPKPKLRVTLPGLSPKTYSTTKNADGSFSVTVGLPGTAQAGVASFRVVGTDAANIVQFTDYAFQLN